MPYVLLGIIGMFLIGVLVTLLFSLCYIASMVVENAPARRITIIVLWGILALILWYGEPCSGLGKILWNGRFATDGQLLLAAFTTGVVLAATWSILHIKNIGRRMPK